MKLRVAHRVAVGALVLLALGGCEWRQKHTTQFDSTVSQMAMSHHRTMYA